MKLHKFSDINLLGFKCYGNQVPTRYGVADKETLAGAKYISGVGWEREKILIPWPLAFMKSLITDTSINKGLLI